MKRRKKRKSVMKRRKKKKFVSKKDIFAFLLISVFLSIFITMVFREKFLDWMVWAFAAITALLLLKGFEKTYKIPKHKRFGFLKHYEVIIGCVIGAVATYFLSVNLNLGVVVGASAVGLLGFYTCHYSKSSKDLPPAIYCGAFVGMASPLILPSILFVALAGFIAGIAYYLSHDVYTGVGGKLGTMAFIGVVITVLIKYLIRGLL